MRVVRHVELAVARARGDDDDAGSDRLIVVEPDAVRPTGAVEAGGLARDREPRAELLRLHLRPAGEGLAGDAGREAEIVLDLGAGARLTAGRDALDDDRARPFGGGVDGGGEPGRAGTDDGDVVDALGSSCLGQAEVIGERRVRRIAQHAVVGETTTGSCVGGDLDAIENPPASGSTSVSRRRCG